MSEDASVSSPQSSARRTYERYDAFDGTVYLPASNGSADKAWIDYRNGSKNPRWKEQVRRGLYAGTPLTGERVVDRSRPCFLQCASYLKPGYEHLQHLTETATVHSDYLWGIPSSPASFSETKANNQALEKLVRKIRSEQTTFQGGIFAGELHSTIMLLRNPAQALRRGVTDHFRSLKKAAKGKRFKSLSRRRKLDIARDTWLESQLGWAPLLSELDSGIQAIAESGVLQNPPWKPVRAVGTHSNVVRWGTRVVGSSTPAWVFQLCEEQEVQIRYISCVDVGTSSALSARRMGFAPSNWLPTLWELIPYSFVADYFANIGTIISAASLAHSSTRWTMKTVRKTRRYKSYDSYGRIYSDSASQSWVRTSWWPGKLLVERTSVSRDRHLGDLVPSLEFKIPGAGTQWLNIAALYDARRELKKFYR